jgi:hypothetical protein
MKKYLKLALVALLASLPQLPLCNGGRARGLSGLRERFRGGKADALAALEQAMTEEVAGADDVVSAMADLTEA